MGIVQDTLLGSQKLTLRDTFITKDMAMNMMMWVDTFDGNIPVPAVMTKNEKGKIIPLWTGKQMYSLLLPVCRLCMMSCIEGFELEALLLSV